MKGFALLLLLLPVFAGSSANWRHVCTNDRIVEKIELINSEKKDTLVLNLKLDYLYKSNQVDSSMAFAIINKEKFSVIKQNKYSQINMYIKGNRYVVKPQSYFYSGIPTSDYFFMTGNLGYILTYPGRVFYIDKKESFFTPSFSKRISKACL